MHHAFLLRKFLKGFGRYLTGSEAACLLEGGVVVAVEELLREAEVDYLHGCLAEVGGYLLSVAAVDDAVFSRNHHAVVLQHVERSGIERGELTGIDEGGVDSLLGKHVGCQRHV